MPLFAGAKITNQIIEHASERARGMQSPFDQ
jgi:hypothetical protein